MKAKTLDKLSALWYTVGVKAEGRFVFAINSIVGKSPLVSGLASRRLDNGKIS